MRWTSLRTSGSHVAPARVDDEAAVTVVVVGDIGDRQVHLFGVEILGDRHLEEPLEHLAALAGAGLGAADLEAVAAALDRDAETLLDLAQVLVELAAQVRKTRVVVR